MKWTPSSWKSLAACAAFAGSVAVLAAGCGSSTNLQTEDAGIDAGTCPGKSTYNPDAGACVCVQTLNCTSPDHFDHVLCACVTGDGGQ